MRLPEFILANSDRIMQGWEDFARSLPRDVLTSSRLRGDAERMLRFIADDMETRQSGGEQYEKSIGTGPQPSGEDPSAAQEHGLARAEDRFSLTELVSEYRALRASVLSLWLNSPDADHDVEQAVRFHEAVDQLVAESVQRYSAKLDDDADTFTASIGHDLRNPLNAISMTAQLLSSSATVSEGERNVVDRAAQTAIRMGTMLGELQDFSRTRLGGVLHLKRERVDVARLCEELIREMRTSAPDGRITFSQAGDTVAMVSAERMEQLLYNVIGNAVRRAAAGCDVNVAVIGQDRMVVVSIGCPGTVMSLDALDRIFEPLYRTHSSNHEKRTDLGLGLYIARTIAIAHGGNIDVTSTEDAGTTFRVRLPRDP